jgi:hypothetical protein
VDVPIVVSSVIQALATVILVIITWRYVQYTKKLVELQIEPRIDIIVPPAVLDAKSQVARILNASGSEIDQVHLEASVGYIDKKDGALSPIRKCISVQHWGMKLRPGDKVVFDFANFFTAQVRAGARHELPDSVDLLEDVIFLGVSARRVVDGKEVAFRERYAIVADENGEAKVSKIGRREFVDSLESPIVRRVKQSP